VQNACKILVGKPERKRLCGRRRSRYEDNITMYLRERGFKAWIGYIWLIIGTGGGLLWRRE
jgi:hypothetical protein